MKNLADFDDLAKLADTQLLDVIEGVPVQINDIFIGQGSQGKFFVISCTDKDGKSYRIRSSSENLLAVMQKALEEGDFPYAAKFVKSGKAWVVR